jgi:hypothetical protein
VAQVRPLLNSWFDFINGTGDARSTLARQGAVCLTQLSVEPKERKNVMYITFFLLRM